MCVFSHSKIFNWAHAYTHRIVHISLENSYTCVSCSLMKLCLLLHISKLYLVLNKVVLSDVASCLLVWIPSLLPVWVPMYIFLYRLKYNAFIPLSTGGFFFTIHLSYLICLMHTMAMSSLLIYFARKNE